MKVGSRSSGHQPAAKMPLTNDSLTPPGSNQASGNSFHLLSLVRAPDLVFSPPQGEAETASQPSPQHSALQVGD